MNAQTVTAASAAAPVSAAKQAANQANAQLSTGPTSSSGKAKCSLNAVKTALTGRAVLLPTEDAALYEQHVRGYEKELRPVGQRECDLVQSIADSSWRLQRIPTLEFAIYAKGQMELAGQFEDQSPAVRAGLIQLETQLANEKQLRNLHLQESRLHRRREKDLAELRQAQSDRRDRDTNTLETAHRLNLHAKRANKPFDPSALGFEFSLSDIEAYGAGGNAVLDIGYAAFKRFSEARANLKAAA
ncbi:MAG: hypothetical protein JO340_02020 [Acidobacteriaceae bacterium]|nr:hypothetical protein [Acidobacteriaceae bacterium]